MRLPLAVWQGSVGAWAALVLCAVLAALAVWDARRFWRGPHRVWDGPPEKWDIGGPAYWHGFTRNVPLVAAYTCGCFLPGLLGSALASGPHDTVFEVGAGIAALTFVVFLPLVLGVFFFNRPRWCVPPHRRDEPGALAEYRAGRRAVPG